MSKKKRIIKKYPNRRLYDTEDSRYITLDGIKELVLAGEDFIVKDVKSEADLTRSILLQIIAEQEHHGEPLFPTETLSHIIRFYGDSVQSIAADFLQKSITFFVHQQNELQKQLQNAAYINPIAVMADLTEKNLATWKKMQDNLFKNIYSSFDNDKSAKD